MFLKNEWYMAAWASELTDAPVARVIANESLVLFRDRTGKVGVLRDQCCHRGVELSPGRIVDGGIECPYHGMVYDCSGQCVHIPVQDKIPSKAKVRYFPAVEKDAIVWIWMGNPEQADYTRIIDYPWHGADPKWPHKEGYLHLQCGYEMLIDNIMDLTHLPFIHKKTIGGNPAKEHTAATMSVERTDRGVSFTRWQRNSTPPPTYTRAINFPGKIDRWVHENLVIPCTIIQWTGGVDVAQQAPEGGSREGGFSMRVMHGIVPETDKTCHYFYSVSNGANQDPTTTQIMFNEVTPTLMEDIAVCESQQKMWDKYPNTQLVDLRSDEARSIYRRKLAEMLAAEQAVQTAPDMAVFS